MTLTEEQRPTAGFDLEKARDVEKAMSPMPWIVLEEAHGEMIIIRNPNHPMHIDGLAAWDRKDEANTPDAIGITYMRENFSNLIDEIERLRAENKIIADRAAHNTKQDAASAKLQAARIKELQAELARVNQLRETEIDQAGAAERIYVEAARLKDARIKELESSLGEAEALTKKNAELMNGYLGRIAELEDALVEERAGAIRCEFYDHCEIDLPDAMIRARQELQADGKIGPDAETGNRDHVVGPDQMIPNGKCWQITEERKAAIWHAVAVLKENDPDDEHLWDEEIAVLRAMLRAAE